MDSSNSAPDVSSFIQWVTHRVFVVYIYYGCLFGLGGSIDDFMDGFVLCRL